MDVWSAPGGLQLHQLATVTCEPNADVRDIHHRMAVILRLEDIPMWLAGGAEAAELMQPWPDGQLTVGQADDVD